MIAPGGLYLLPEPYDRLYVNAQVTLWIAMAAFLYFHVRAEKKRVAVISAIDGRS